LHLVDSFYEFYRFINVVAVKNFLFNFSNFSAECSIACLTNNGAMGPQYAAALNELGNLQAPLLLHFFTIRPALAKAVPTLSLSYKEY
jgi:hypothetical protein